MIKTVVRFHHWTPEVINGLYLDDMDHFGLIYWYDDTVEYDEELKVKVK